MSGIRSDRADIGEREPPVEVASLLRMRVHAERRGSVRILDEPGKAFTADATASRSGRRRKLADDEYTLGRCAHGIGLRGAAPGEQRLPVRSRRQGLTQRKTEEVIFVLRDDQATAGTAQNVRSPIEDASELTRVFGIGGCGEDLDVQACDTAPELICRHSDQINSCSPGEFHVARLCRAGRHCALSC